ncbi:MAG: hypothetical protein HON78_03560 [Legionellales bacterium]|nr:hypothetical protein [Legionellales bacterium]
MNELTAAQEQAVAKLNAGHDAKVKEITDAQEQAEARVNELTAAQEQAVAKLNAGHDAKVKEITAANEDQLKLKEEEIGKLNNQLEDTNYNIEGRIVVTVAESLLEKDHEIQGLKDEIENLKHEKKELNGSNTSKNSNLTSAGIFSNHNRLNRESLKAASVKAKSTRSNASSEKLDEDQLNNAASVTSIQLDVTAVNNASTDDGFSLSSNSSVASDV